METILNKHWHHLPVDETLQLLDTSADRGLDLFAVKHRQEQFGANVLAPQKRTGPLKRLLLQFHNPLVYILLGAAGITALLKDPVDAITIFVVVLINAAVGFLQEHKAERAIQALAQSMTAEAAVLRAGRVQRVPAGELVPGDVIALAAGDKVPADLRLIQTSDLQVAESALTGESVPVEKSAAVILSPDSVLADRRNMAYASTLVTSGSGRGVTVATGARTEVGRISGLIEQSTSLDTPLTQRIRRFSALLLWVIVVLAVLAFIAGMITGRPMVESLLMAITLAVAAIPEGLPAAFTVTLAIGVARMARRRAIIRKLPAVETLGSTTVVCTDKTGTLTQNEMTVTHVVVGDRHYRISGQGYHGDGDITGPLEPKSDPLLMDCLTAGALCNDSHLEYDKGEWHAQGDPTEIALLAAAAKAGLDQPTLLQRHPRLASLPFSSDHQYMATLHQGRTVYVKGSVEQLLKRCGDCNRESGETGPIRRSRLLKQAEELAAEGLRVLALAKKRLPGRAPHLTHQQVAGDLTFLGLQAMLDPPRPEAGEAIAACHRAGVDVKMITGDHALTGVAIARRLGLMPDQAGDAAVMTGAQLARLSDEELIHAVEETAVFARVSPEQKFRLVDALQSRGHVVAMTGDGINDAPALKQADIGIAMGRSGTEVAKEAADMVLTDDRFATIEAAIEEGRGVFDNLIKFVTWALPANLGQGLLLLVAAFSGAALPILPVQVLWINMTTSGVLGLVLAFEHKEPDLMHRPPRRTGAPILDRVLIGRILLVGLLTVAASFWMFEWELMRGAGLAEARTVVVNMIAFSQLFYLLNCRSLRESSFKIGFFGNRWLVAGVVGLTALQILFTYNPLMNRILGSTPFVAAAWWRILLLALASYLIVEVEKTLRRVIQKRGRKDAAQTL